MMYKGMNEEILEQFKTFQMTVQAPFVRKDGEKIPATAGQEEQTKHDFYSQLRAGLTVVSP